LAPNGGELAPEQISALVRQASIAAFSVFLAVVGFGSLAYLWLSKHLARTYEYNKEAVEGQIAMIEALGAAIAKRDSDTGAHNFRVAWIAARIGLKMGVKKLRLQALIAGSFLHDVGKIGIPDAILLKPGRLEGQELQIMRTHVELGEQILSRISWLRDAKDVVGGHHEKWDGSGYPKGAKGKEIPLLARIFAVADVFDALCSRRPYKDPMGFDESMTHIKNGSGNHFDPSVVNAFETIARELFDTLDGSSEEAARDLVGDMLRDHFGLSGILPNTNMISEKDAAGQ
jgi:HD-GYP domain-containing protein (c-di-GMP phosphodiesterase class II)